MNLSEYIKNIYLSLPGLKEYEYPWDITSHAEHIILELIKNLGDEYIVKNNIAIHKTATVELYVTLKAPIVIGKNCFIASGAYLRNGVFLGSDVKIGPSCEVKSSFIFHHTSLAHFNYVGNSLIGSGVNFEAGTILANHFNERDDKTIKVKIGKKTVIASTEKFGSVVGDNSNIGANAVISPGHMLPIDSIVKRLELLK